MNVFIDIETIPDQTVGAIASIAENLEVKAPSLTKPKLIEALDLGDQGKYKTVDELKELWVSTFAESEKENQATEQWLKTSFDGGKGQLCCVGIAIGEDPVITLTGSEKQILESVNVLLKEYPSVTFVAHNKKFDLPFLFKRFVINGIEPQFNFDAYTKKHICTMELWEGFGGRICLDNLAKQLGLGGKYDGMDGSQVWPEFKAGNIDKIAEYCADDVRLLREIYNKINFIK